MKTSPDTVIQVDATIAHISPLNTRQPTAKDVAELMVSLNSTGQVTPAIGRPHPEKKGEYELAAGARRKMACQTLGRPLDLIVRDIPDEEFEDMILTDNLQREDPDPLQEAILIERRLAAGATPGEIAARYGKSETWLKRRMKLVNLSPAIRKEWAPGKIFGHYTTEMMEFFGALDAAAQKEITKDHWTYQRCGTLQNLSAAFHHHAADLKDTEWLNDPCTFVDGCGPGCNENTANALFPDEKHPCGSCVNTSCFKKRANLYATFQLEKVLASRKLTEFILFPGDYQGRVDIAGTSYKGISQWDRERNYKILKKPKEGAKIALNLADPLNPLVCYLAPKNENAAKSLSNESSGPDTPKETREERLTGKRLAAINNKLAEHLKNTNSPADGTPILTIVAAFGTDGSRSYSNDREFKRAWASIDSPDKIPGFDDYNENTYSREEFLWLRVRPILLGRLTFHTARNLLEKHRVPEMRRISTLTGFDYDAEWETICRTGVTIPKSWGHGIDPMTLKPIKTKAAAPDPTPKKSTKPAAKKTPPKKAAKNKAAAV